MMVGKLLEGGTPFPVRPLHTHCGTLCNTKADVYKTSVARGMSTTYVQAACLHQISSLDR